MRGDSKQPDGSHQSHFSFRGVISVGRNGGGANGKERHQPFNLNKLIDF